MILETLFIGLLSAYLHKRLRIHLVIKKKKGKQPLMKGAQPFFIDKKSKVGILLLHGFTSTPQEVKGLGKYLAKKGYTVYAPLITGHGTSVFDLVGTNWQDWENSVLNAYNKLKKEVKTIYVIGSSLGGNLGIRLATKKKINLLITMGTPMFFKNELSKKLIMRVLSLFRNFVKKKHGKKIKKIIKKKVHYMQVPLKSLREVAKIVRQSEKDLPKIKCPALIMQSSTDQLLPNENAYLIYNKINSKIKKNVFIPDSYHVFCMDKHKQKAFKTILEFIKEIEKKKK